MFRIFYFTETDIETSKDITLLKKIPTEKILWVDLQHGTESEQYEIETFFQIPQLKPKEATEIESSSRFYEREDYTCINSNFLIKEGNNYVGCPVTFYIIENILITHRNADLDSFAETVRRINHNKKLFHKGIEVLETIFEIRVDLDADMLENVAKEISIVSKNLSPQSGNEQSQLLRINGFQETTMLIMENIIDKQRVVSALLKSSSVDNKEKFRVLIKDINSLVEYASFSFERLEFLKNTLLGLINIEQNKTIKIFTVASVVFMPPTLIASIYGMNFDIMPELHWKLGYAFAMVLILLSSVITLYIFKRKKWL